MLVIGIRFSHGHQLVVPSDGTYNLRSHINCGGNPFEKYRSFDFADTLRNASSLPAGY